MPKPRRTLILARVIVAIKEIKLILINQFKIFTRTREPVSLFQPWPTPSAIFWVLARVIVRVIVVPTITRPSNF